MAWFKVDDTFAFNPKVLQCSLEAIGLWTLAGTWSAQQCTDGFIPKQMVEAFASRLLEANKNFASILLQLTDSGLWLETPHGYQFHDWDEYQPSATVWKETRRKRSEAGKKGGLKSAEVRRSKREANGQANASSKIEPRPDPRERPDKSGTRSKKTALPDGWQPNENHLAKATVNGINIHTEADKFRNYHEARGTKFVSWDAAFHNWLTKASEYANATPATPQPTQPAPANTGSWYDIDELLDKPRF